MLLLLIVPCILWACVVAARPVDKMRVEAEEQAAAELKAARAAELNSSALNTTV